MSNNASVTATVVKSVAPRRCKRARCALCAMRSHDPDWLKPQTKRVAVVVQGRFVDNAKGREYQAISLELLGHRA